MIDIVPVISKGQKIGLYFSHVNDGEVFGTIFVTLPMISDLMLFINTMDSYPDDYHEIIDYVLITKLTNDDYKVAITDGEEYVLLLTEDLQKLAEEFLLSIGDMV